MIENKEHIPTLIYGLYVIILLPSKEIYVYFLTRDLTIHFILISYEGSL